MNFFTISLLSLLVTATLADSVLPVGKTHTIQLGTSDTIPTLKDDGTAGVGDLFIWDRRNKIYKTDDPAEIAGSDAFGDNQGHCIRLTNDGSASEWDCTFTIYFSDGQVHAQGPFNDGETVVAITGGTGKYAGASGTMSLAPGDSHAEDGTVADDGEIFSYHYVFNLEMGEKAGGEETGEESGSNRHLAQCGNPSVMGAIQLGLLGTIPWW